MTKSSKARELFLKGHSVSAISKLLGMHYSHVYSVTKKMKVSEVSNEKVWKVTKTSKKRIQDLFFKKDLVKLRPAIASNSSTQDFYEAIKNKDITTLIFTKKGFQINIKEYFRSNDTCSILCNIDVVEFERLLESISPKNGSVKVYRSDDTLYGQINFS